MKKLLILLLALGALALISWRILGRRGTPNKLGVPGEELSKVSYSLLDAHSYSGRRILVVGGGDSAVEAALGLAEQPGNDIPLTLILLVSLLLFLWPSRRSSHTRRAS